jgi:hypothetical protein
MNVCKQQIQEYDLKNDQSKTDVSMYIYIYAYMCLYAYMYLYMYLSYIGG